MHKFSTNIQLGEGLGEIKFGMSRDEVKKLVGEADEVEPYEHSDIDDKRAEAWHYDDPELSLAFEEFNNWKLTSIAISSPDFTLEGTKFLGMSFEEVLSKLQALDLGKPEVENLSDEEIDSVKLVTLEDYGLNLWFEEDILSEIQFSQIWEDEQEDD